MGRRDSSAGAGVCSGRHPRAELSFATSRKRHMLGRLLSAYYRPPRYTLPSTWISYILWRIFALFVENLCTIYPIPPLYVLLDSIYGFSAVVPIMYHHIFSFVCIKPSIRRCRRD